MVRAIVGALEVLVAGGSRRLRLFLSLVRVAVDQTGLPVPAPRDVIYRWAFMISGQRPRTSGRVAFYTGGLYQLAPYIRASVRIFARL